MRKMSSKSFDRLFDDNMEGGGTKKELASMNISQTYESVDHKHTIITLPKGLIAAPGHHNPQCPYEPSIARSTSAIEYKYNWHILENRY